MKIIHDIVLSMMAGMAVLKAQLVKTSDNEPSKMWNSGRCITPEVLFIIHTHGRFCCHNSNYFRGNYTHFPPHSYFMHSWYRLWLHQRQGVAVLYMVKWLHGFDGTDNLLPWQRDNL